MTTHSERKLEKLLTGAAVPEPPSGLRDRLVEEIPEEIELHPAVGGGRVAPFPTRRTWRLAAAAMVTVALTGAVTWRLQRQSTATSGEALQQLARRSAPSEVTTAPGHGLGDDTTEGEELGSAGWAPPESDRVAPILQAGERDRRTSTAAPATTADEGTSPGPPPPSSPAPAEFEALPLGLAESAPEEEVRRGSARVLAPSPQAASPAEGLMIANESKRQLEAPRPPLEMAGATAAAAPPPSAASVGRELRDELRVEDSLRVRGDGAGEPRSATRLPQLSPSGVALVTPEKRHSFDLDLARELPPAAGERSQPDDAPYDQVYFRGYGVNPFVDTADDPLSTFALEVDTASYTVVRRFLEDGHLPPPDAVRVEEMVNAFEYFGTAPADADVLLTAEAARSPYTDDDRHRVMVFGVAFPTVERSERPAAVLTFVVDTSGSMARENRLGLVQRALATLLTNLEPGDRVGLVTYGSHAEIVLEPTGDHELVRRALDRLVPSGSTNAEEGLVLGYRLAAEFFRPGGVNRVVLCSDGVANVGRTGPESILERIRAEAGRGIELTAVGVGMGNYNDVLLERLADTADGRYAYVDTFDEARRLFVEELGGTLYTVAHDAKVQVEFNPAVIGRWRLLGYENRDVADDRFRDPSVDAGEIGAGHGAVAVYEVELADDRPPGAEAATLRVRYRPTGTDGEIEVVRGLPGEALDRPWSRARPSLRLAATVAELAELLRGSSWARTGSYATVAGELDRLASELDDPRVAETATLARTAARLVEAAHRPPAERD